MNRDVHLQVSMLLITIQLPPLPHVLGEHIIIGPAVDTVVGLAVDVVDDLAVDTVVGLAVDAVVESSADPKNQMKLHTYVKLV